MNHSLKGFLLYGDFLKVGDEDEKEVAALVAQGLGNPEIAVRLGVMESTEALRKAAMEFEKAIELGLPEDEEVFARHWLADSKMRLGARFVDWEEFCKSKIAFGQYKEAMDHYERALSMDKEGGFGFYLDSLMRASLKEYSSICWVVSLRIKESDGRDASITYLEEKLLYLDYLPTNPGLSMLFELGNIYANKGDLQRAHQAFKKIVDAEVVDLEDANGLEAEIRREAASNVRVALRQIAEKQQGKGRDLRWVIGAVLLLLIGWIVWSVSERREGGTNGNRKTEYDVGKVEELPKTPIGEVGMEGLAKETQSQVEGNKTSLAGLWNGGYVERDWLGQEQNVQFELKISEHGERVVGSTRERGADGRTLVATVEGKMQGRDLVMTKKYEGIGAQNVVYKGTIGENGKGIRGSWQAGIRSGTWWAEREGIAQMPDGVGGRNVDGGAEVKGDRPEGGGSGEVPKPKSWD